MHKARGLFEEALIHAQKLRVSAAETDLRAGLGLLLYQQGDRQEAEKHWRYVRELNHDGMSGVQDRFKVAWLQAYGRWERDPAEAVAYLGRVAASEETTDVPSSLKLSWLSELLAAVRAEDSRGRLEAEITLDSETADRLREHELGWFLYFSRRWLKQTVAQGRTVAK